MTIFLSVITAFICILAFILGVYFGRSVQAKAPSLEPTAEQRKKSDEDMKAICQVFGYSEKQAYGGNE